MGSWKDIEMYVDQPKNVIVEEKYLDLNNVLVPMLSKLHTKSKTNVPGLVLSIKNILKMIMEHFYIIENS